MSESTSAGVDDPSTTRRRAAIPVRARTIRILIIVLAVVLVAAAGTAAWLGLQVRDEDKREKDQAAAANVAAQFALRMDKVDGTKFDAYIKQVNELLTTKAKTKNTEVFDVMKQTYQTAKVKGSGKVLLTGVGNADEDSATVLVVHDADVTTTQGSLKHHYRWTVDLVKVDGTWRVDDFNPVS